MTKRQIKSLVLQSYTRNNLDVKKVKKIIKFLSRNNLKQYVKTLKAYEESKEVSVVLPSIDENKDIERKLREIFPNKKIIFSQDPSLMLGAKIIDNDKIFEFNLKNTLENLGSYIESE